MQELQQRVAELEAQQKAFLVTPFGDVTLSGGKEALLWAEEFARKMKGPAVPAVAVPDGYALVPVDLDAHDDITDAACDAGNLYRLDFVRAWAAAIAAAQKGGA